MSWGVCREFGIYVAELLKVAERSSVWEAKGEWATPATEFNGQTCVFPSYYANEQGINCVYGTVMSDHTLGGGGGRQVGVFKIIKKKNGHVYRTTRLHRAM